MVNQNTNRTNQDEAIIDLNIANGVRSPTVREGRLGEFDLPDGRASDTTEAKAAALVRPFLEWSFISARLSL